MAQVFGERSEYLIKGDRNNFIVASVFVFIIILSIFLYWASYFNAVNKADISLLAILFVIVVFVSKFIGERSLNKSNTFELGRSGEYAVCDELKRLPDEFFVFQDAKISSMGKSNIDFIVVGPTGLFYIEAKNHPGWIYFNKTSKQLERGYKFFENNFIIRAIDGACKLRAYIVEKTRLEYLYVDSLLVFSNQKAQLKFKSDVVQNLDIIKMESMNEFIIKNERKLSVEEIALIKNELNELILNK